MMRLVRLDFGEGETDSTWTVCELDGKTWRVVGTGEVAYIAQMGPELPAPVESELREYVAARGRG